MKRLTLLIISSTPSLENIAQIASHYFRPNQLLALPHLLMRAISERFLPAWTTFRVDLANENHWM